MLCTDRVCSVCSKLSVYVSVTLLHEVRVLDIYDCWNALCAVCIDSACVCIYMHVTTCVLRPKEKPAFREQWKVGVKQLERAMSLLEIFGSTRIGLATGFDHPSIHLPARTDYFFESILFWA